MNKESFFTPQPINDFFYDICQKPHGSGQENEVRQYVIEVINQFNQKHPQHPIQIVHYDKKANTPGQRVIVLRKEAAPGLVGKPTVILQAHMDMVCVPHDNIFPLALNKYTDEEGITWLKAGGKTEKDGTTLGADNGMGVATALAIITDTEQNYGPIECLFTVQEETNLAGAREFDLNWLTGSAYINLDSEDKDIITYGSAGGSEALYKWKPQTEFIPANNITYNIRLLGLKGGHSGVNIADGNANGIKILAELLNHLRTVIKPGFNLVSFTGGIASNAIPNDVVAIITFDAQYIQDVSNQCHEILTGFKQLYKNTDPDFTWQITPVDNSLQMIATVDSNNLLELLTLLPTGPLKMIASRPEVVETSANLAIIKANTAMVNIHCSTRSSNENSLAIIETIQKAAARLFGLEMFLDLDTFDPQDLLNEEYPIENSGILIISGNYPGWEPNEKSPLLTIAKEVYQDIYKGKFQAQIIHAGLECGWVVKRFAATGRRIDCISIGPSARGLHTWNERLDTASVEPFYRSVIEIIKKVQA